MIDLDANFLVDVFEPGTTSPRSLDRWIRNGESINMSSIAWAEFLCGPVEPTRALKARSLLATIEPFTDVDAGLAAELFNTTSRRSRSLADCMIAALAIRRRAALATLDREDFSRFRSFGLKLA
jgi:predicted nucleic acid-binding protein